MHQRFSLDFSRHSWVCLILLLLSASPSHAQVSQQPATAESVARLTQRLIDMEAVMTDLTGKVEELQHQNQLLQQRVQQMQQDNEFRFGRLEQATGLAAGVAPAQVTSAQASARPSVPASAAAGATVPVTAMAGGGGAAAAQTPVGPTNTTAPVAPAGGNQATATQNGYAPASGVLGYLPNSQAGAQAGSGQTGSGQTGSGQTGSGQTGSGQAAATPPPAAATADSAAANAAASGAALAKPAANAPPEQLYNYAFNLLRQSEYPQAEAAFKDFLAKYPKHDLASNADYWLGQSYVVRGDYKQAEVVLLDGYRRYPKGNKAPDTLYLLGLSAGKLGQTKEACAAYKRFGAEYPTAPDLLKHKVAAEKQQLACTG